MLESTSTPDCRKEAKMKAGVSSSCFHIRFIARPAIHLQMISQIQSPDFRNPGWKMSHNYIYKRIQDYLKFRAPRYVISAIQGSEPLAESHIHSRTGGQTYVHMYMRAQPGRAHWRQPCARLRGPLGFFAAVIWQLWHWRKS